MTDEKTFSIIGPGRLGGNLIYNLESKGWKCNLIVTRNPAAHDQLRKEHQVQERIGPKDNPGKNIFISVNDDAIGEIALMLADSGISLSDIRCLHFSGVLPSDILKPVREEGAAIGSLHPLYCFSKKPEKLPAGILFTFEGNEQCLGLADSISRDLDGIIYLIDKSKKALYHCAASMAGNMSLALLYAAFRLFNHALGDKREGQKESLIILVRSALNNLESSDWKDALTGPISRGDIVTINKHLESLKEYGKTEFEDLYNILKNMTERMIDDSK
jgi:predicted short-subunit dehydrogenase-like oxidoreductase (DUF2520 family)